MTTATPSASPATGFRPIAAQLVTIGPARGDHRGAFRVGASLLVPLVVLFAVGRLDWSAYAVFGAFASLYGRSLGYRERTGMQVTAAVSMIAAVVLGTVVSLAPDARWIAVVVGALISWGAATVSVSLSWHPPGPLFQVFGFAACAAVPATATSVPIALGLSTASALLAVAIGRVGSLRHGRRLPRGIVWPTVGRFDPSPLLRYLLAPLVAGLLALAFGWGHSYWAMVAAVVPLAAADTRGQLTRAAQRIAGTVVGVGLAAAVLALHTSGLFAIAVIVLMQIGAELFVGRNYAVALVFVTPLALMMGELSHATAAGPLLRDRTLETALGVAVAIVITLVTHLRRTRIRPAISD